MAAEAVEEVRPSPRALAERQSVLPLGDGDGEFFQLPPLDLLEKAKPKKGGETPAALEQNARRIEAELKNFGVIGRVTNIRPGPVITIYELEPAPGVKSSAVLGLQDDLARAMSALSIRIAVVPREQCAGD